MGELALQGRIQQQKKHPSERVFGVLRTKIRQVWRCQRYGTGQYRPRRRPLGRPLWSPAAPSNQHNSSRHHASQQRRPQLVHVYIIASEPVQQPEKRVYQRGVGRMHAPLPYPGFNLYEVKIGVPTVGIRCLSVCVPAQSGSTQGQQHQHSNAKQAADQRM